MKRMFLASEFSVSGDKIKQVLDINNYSNAAYIGNATDLDLVDTETSANKDKFRSLGINLTNVDLRDFENKSIKDELIKYQAIYFEGGNTYYLLDLANRIGLTKVIHELIHDHKILYIGTSAGSIIAGPDVGSSKPIEDWDVVPELKDYSAFNLVDFVVIPHIGNDDFFKDNEDKYNELFSGLKNFDYPHIAIRDQQAIWVEDESFKIL